MSIDFRFNAAIPAANNNPSNDQPIMLQNNLSTQQILDVDHVTFNDNLGGTHKQVTFTSKNPPTGLPTDTTSILYTNNIASPGTFNTESASNISEMFYANQSATFPISMIKAFGSFDGVANPLNTWNMNATGGAGSYTITMPVNVCHSTNYLVFIQTAVGGGSPLTASYSSQTNTTFSVQVFVPGGSAEAPLKFSVLVMEL